MARDLHVAGRDFCIFVLNADLVRAIGDLFNESLNGPPDQLRRALLYLANLFIRLHD